MTNTTLTATAVLAAVVGTAAVAAPVDDLVAKLRAEGWTKIEVEPEGAAHMEIEAYRDGMEREILIMTATGEVILDSVEADDDDRDGDDD
jgi:hypothetical protein